MNNTSKLTYSEFTITELQLIEMLPLDYASFQSLLAAGFIMVPSVGMRRVVGMRDTPNGDRVYRYINEES